MILPSRPTLQTLSKKKFRTFPRLMNQPLGVWYNASGFYATASYPLCKMKSKWSYKKKTKFF
jgi:hypothetical protein